MPLRFMLMVPFVAQTMIAVGVTGWLAIRNGKQAIGDLVEQYQREITSHVVHELDISLSTPHHINQLAVSAFQQGDIDFTNQKDLERYFWHQLRHHPGINYIYAGNVKGGIVGVGKAPDGRYRSFQTDQFQSGPFLTFEATSQGDRLRRLPNSGEYYDARQRPWYQAATEARQATWSKIYRYVGEGWLGITASQPIYSESGQLLGVLGVDVVLEQLSEFLRQYELPEHSRALVLERSGYIVASSAEETPFIQTSPNSDQERKHISQSDDRLIQSIATYFSPSNQPSIESQQNIPKAFQVEGETYFLQVMPFRDEYGLDWLIVLVLPEAEFTAPIQSYTHQTIFLCLIALGITVMLGRLTAGWITRPILQLSEASEAIAKNDFSKTVHLDRNDEVGVLARAFNTMAVQLRQVFQSMEDRASDLEKRVEDRTRHLLEANHQLKAEVDERNRMASELQASEQKYRALFDGSPDAVTIFDGNVFVDCNSATLRMFRCETKNQFCCKHPLDFSPAQQPNGQDSASLAKTHMAATRHKGTHQFEWMHQRLDGDLFWADVWLSIVCIGGQAMTQAVIRDVTQRRQNEEALIDNARLSALSSRIGSVLTQGRPLEETLEHCASALVTHLTLDSARFWVFNPTTQTLELTASEGKYQHLDPFQRSVRVGHSRIGWIAEHQRPYMTESVLNHLHINHQAWEQHPQPMAFAGYPLSVEDQLVGVMAVMTRRILSDATQQELASISNEIALGIHHARVEEALRESEARYRSIVENTSDQIAILHLDGTFLYASPNYKTVLGYEPSELIGTSWAPLIHPDDLRALVEFAHRLPLLATSQQSPEYRVRTSNGEWRWYVSAASCVKNSEGTPLYLVSIGRDISDRIRTEDTLRQAKDLAESANQAKSVFLRTMSHELRTPLNGILGFAQALKRTPGLPSKHYDGLNVIQNSGEHLLGLIEELLDFSRIEAQRMELHPIAFNPAELLDEIAELFRSRARQKGITFQVAVPESLPPMIWGDAQRLRQVLINLVENAIKFTDEGSVILWVNRIVTNEPGMDQPGMDQTSDQIADDQHFPLDCSWPPEPHLQICQTFPHQMLQFQVEDTGFGIADSDLDVIFHPFHQGQHIRQAQEGTGLGLSISKKIIEVMGGELRVDSVLGEGSRFWFNLTFPILPSAIASLSHGDLNGSGHETAVSSPDTNPSGNTTSDPNHLDAKGHRVQNSHQSSSGHSPIEGRDKVMQPAPDFQIDKLPDQAAIAHLTHLARIGDIQGILAYLEDLEDQHPELMAFIQAIRLRAKSFQVRSIRKFLKTVSETAL